MAFVRPPVAVEIYTFARWKIESTTFRNVMTLYYTIYIQYIYILEYLHLYGGVKIKKNEKKVSYTEDYKHFGFTSSSSALRAPRSFRTPRE